MKKYKFTYTFEGRLKQKSIYAKTIVSAKNKFNKNMKQNFSVVEILCIEEIAEILYGIWNTMKKEFQFGIKEKTSKLAMKKLFNKIGYDSLKWRFEAKPIEEKRI